MLSWLIVRELPFVWFIDWWQLLPLILSLWPVVPFNGTVPCSDNDLMCSYVLAEFGCWYGFECGSNCVGWYKIEFGLIVVMHGVDATAVNRLSIVDVVLIKPFFLTGSSVYRKFQITLFLKIDFSPFILQCFSCKEIQTELCLFNKPNNWTLVWCDTFSDFS